MSGRGALLRPQRLVRLAPALEAELERLVSRMGERAVVAMLGTTVVTLDRARSVGVTRKAAERLVRALDVVREREAS